MSFDEFVSAVQARFQIIGFPYPGRDCYIFISDSGYIGELWRDVISDRIELHLHKMGEPNLSVAALPGTSEGVVRAISDLTNFFEKA